jgi:acetyl-CoA acyltransferase 1
MASLPETIQAQSPTTGDTIVVKHHLITKSTQAPATQEIGPQDPPQMTLPSTEIPNSPIDPSESFTTEVNEERPAVTVIPSSLTPPPSTQVNNSHIASQPAPSKRKFSGSQQSTLFSPPATVPNNVRDRASTSEFLPPPPQQVLEASADELRAMLQSAIAEQQKLKMETAHHKLQYSLLSLQADDDAKRAAVEHEMMRREVDALRNAEHTRQARKDLSSASETVQVKYLQMKTWYEATKQENEILQRRVTTAKKVIKQSEDECIALAEERDMLLNRIRENREHMQMLCRPGGIFHGALTPKQKAAVVSNSQGHRTSQQPASRSQVRDRQGEHGLSALLQAMSQDNNSAPSTPMHPHRPTPRHVGKHSRNAQSMSSLPTTPMNRPVGAHVGLLPSADLVPHTEPHRYSQRQFIPTTPTSQSERRRRSRESTISVDDNEELARQALESVAAAQSFTSQAPHTSHSRNRNGEDQEIYDSQASQAATEMLRRDPRQSFEVAESRKNMPGAMEKSVRMQEKLLSHRNGDGDKRKFSENYTSTGEARRDQESPAKKSRVVEPLTDGHKKLGLGIQYKE